jgi:DNA polymerase I
MKHPPLVGFDTETELIGPGRLAPRLVVMSVMMEGNAPELVAHGEAPAVFRAMLEASVRGELELVGCNVAFDLAVFCHADPSLIPLVFDAVDAGGVYDVRIAEVLRAVALDRLEYDPEIGRPPTFALAELETKYLGSDRSAEKKAPDAWRLRYAELLDVPLEQWPPDAVAYCHADARGPVEVALAQRKANRGDLPLLRDSIRHAFALHLMSARGVRTDGATVAALRLHLEELVEAASFRLQAAGILRRDGTEDTQATKARVLKALGTAAPLTKTGKTVLDRDGELTANQRLKYTSTDDESLDACGGADPILDLWREVKRNRKELGTNLPVLEKGAQYPINARFNPIVSTFRTSCSDPNIQQQPRRSGVRECFVPRPGYVFCSVDYHVAELCSLAQCLLDLFGASAMADELRAGRDLHVVFAADLAGISYDEAKALSKAKDPRIKELRQASKAANFGIPGGLGAAALARYAKGYGVILSESEAVDLRNKWLARFPEMRNYFRHVSDQCRGGTFEHRHPRTGFLRGGVGYTDGCNHAFQHLTAAGAKEALYRVTREAYTDRSSALWGTYPIMFVHDEIIAEVPQATAHEAAHRIAEVMVATMNRYTPDVPARAEPALMRRWYKGAEPVYVDGRLVPWEPGA